MNKTDAWIRWYKKAPHEAQVALDKAIERIQTGERDHPGLQWAINATKGESSKPPQMMLIDKSFRTPWDKIIETGDMTRHPFFYMPPEFIDIYGVLMTKTMLRQYHIPFCGDYWLRINCDSVRRDKKYILENGTVIIGHFSKKENQELLDKYIQYFKTMHGINVRLPTINEWFTHATEKNLLQDVKLRLSGNPDPEIGIFAPNKKCDREFSIKFTPEWFDHERGEYVYEELEGNEIPEITIENNDSNKFYTINKHSWETTYTRYLEHNGVHGFRFVKI